MPNNTSPQIDAPPSMKVRIVPSCLNSTSDLAKYMDEHYPKSKRNKERLFTQMIKAIDHRLHLEYRDYTNGGYQLVGITASFLHLIDKANLPEDDNLASYQDALEQGGTHILEVARGFGLQRLAFILRITSIALDYDPMFETAILTFIAPENEDSIANAKKAGYSEIVLSNEAIGFFKLSRPDLKAFKLEPAFVLKAIESLIEFVQNPVLKHRTDENRTIEVDVSQLPFCNLTDLEALRDELKGEA